MVTTVIGSVLTVFSAIVAAFFLIGIIRSRTVFGGLIRLYLAFGFMFIALVSAKLTGI
jgi:hypothetical protein